MPPWDAWLAWAGASDETGRWQLLDGYLVSWIPAELVPLVDAAIDVSPTETLLWAEDASEDAFVAKLRARGFLA